MLLRHSARHSYSLRLPKTINSATSSAMQSTFIEHRNRNRKTWNFNAENAITPPSQQTFPPRYSPISTAQRWPFLQAASAHVLSSSSERVDHGRRCVVRSGWGPEICRVHHSARTEAPLTWSFVVLDAARASRRALSASSWAWTRRSSASSGIPFKRRYILRTWLLFVPGLGQKSITWVLEVRSVNLRDFIYRSDHGTYQNPVSISMFVPYLSNIFTFFMTRSPTCCS